MKTIDNTYLTKCQDSGNALYSIILPVGLPAITELILPFSSVHDSALTLVITLCVNIAIRAIMPRSPQRHNGQASNQLDHS